MSYPGSDSYGRCDDCGGAAYTKGPDGQVCRECHGDRANFIARNAYARASVLWYLSEEFGERYRPYWSPASAKSWEEQAPERARQRAIVQANLDAYARGEFPPDESLTRGTHK